MGMTLKKLPTNRESLEPYLKDLLSFQKDTVCQSLQILNNTRTHSVYIANEQGTGKTPTALVLANIIRPTLPVLILCPLVMKYVWEKEIYKWYRGSLTRPSIPKVQVLESTKEDPDFTSQFIICSYDSAWREPLISKLAPKGKLDYRFSLLINDEAHALKEQRAKRSKAVYRQLFPISYYKLFLSGTPMTRAGVDLYAPFHAINPEYLPFNSFLSFVERHSYSRPAPTGRGTIYFGLKNGEELSKHIRSHFFIRYRKADVLKDLPKKLYTKVPLPASLSVTPSPAANMEVLRFLDALIKGTPPPAVVSDSLATQRRLQGEKKVKSVVEYVENLLEQNQPVVVFAHHKAVISDIKSGLTKYNPVVITGDTSSKERAEYVEQFQEGKTNLFIGNFIAAGTGITLTRAANVVLAELDWTPAVLSQAIDRCHRIGSEHESVVIHYFIVKDSIDEQIADTLINKIRDFKIVIDGEQK